LSTSKRSYQGVDSEPILCGLDDIRIAGIRDSPLILTAAIGEIPFSKRGFVRFRVSVA
jgi:hypothetical protein